MSAAVSVSGHEWVYCGQCGADEMLARVEDLGKVVCPHCAEPLTLDPEVFASELDALFREHERG